MGSNEAPTAASDAPALPSGPPAQSWQRYLEQDFFETEGRRSGLTLPETASTSQVDKARTAVGDWARSVGLMAVIDQCRIDERQLTAQGERVDDLREQLPNWQQQVLDSQKVLDDVRSQGVPEKPRRPPIWLFLLVGTALGAVFGLVGATTISSVLRSVWRVTVADPASFYMSWGVGLGLFIGVIIGTATILTREFAVGSGRFVRWGPFLMGLCFATGLAGYRFLQTGDSGELEVHVSGVAVVLMLLEIGVLLAIEVVNHVALAAWERYHVSNHEYTRWAGREKAALLALEARTKVFDEAKHRLAREYGVLADMEEKDRFYKHAIQNLDYLKEFVVQAAQRGFELGLRERRGR